jgi:glycerol-3-phosphate O-acyltransferase
MSSRFGPVLAPLAGALLDSIPYPEEAAERVRELAERGTVVYVHRSRNAVEYLALSRAARRLQLPGARFVGGLDTFWWQPWWRLLGIGRGTRGAPKDRDRRDEWLLRRCVQRGDAAELFLRRPLTLVTTRPGYRARYVEALIALQRESDRPIYLVPHLLALRRRPASFEPTAADAVFGTGEEPGALRAFTRLAVSRGVARWEVSEPIDLLSFVREREQQSDAVLAKKVRWVLLNHLARSERAVHGPARKSPARMRDDTLKDPVLRDRIRVIAEETDQDEASLFARAPKLYDEIAARYDIDVIRLLDAMMKLVWSRIYDGLEIDEAGIERVRQASRKGPLVFVPSHRSHVDYLVMSQALLWNGLMSPHVAAGANLSFFPLGPVLRRGGAYFLRRSFGGDRLYSSVFRAYVKRLFTEGFSQEFFIEGGRSRTGKTLPPKMGMLMMTVDAFLESRREDAMFVPACISYERIVEGESYTRELGGEEKQAESAGALISAAGVLRSKYGRVFVTIDEPLSLRDFMDAQGFDADDHTPEQKRRLVQVLAHAISYGINRAQVVTANALVVSALFGYRRRGVQRALLDEAVQLMVAHLLDVAGGRALFPAGLLAELEAFTDAALDRLVEDGLVARDEAAGQAFFRVKDEAFLALDFYKNNILHHFVPEAILATAARSLGAKRGEALARAALQDRARALSRAFKFEFIYPVDATFEQTFDACVARNVDRGFLSDEGAQVRVPEEPRAAVGLAYTANLIASFVESYESVVRHVGDVVGDAESRKALVLRLLELCRADWLSGGLRCAEAVNKAAIENAIRLLEDQGILTWQGERPTLVEERSGAREELAALLDASRPPRPEAA